MKLLGYKCQEKKPLYNADDCFTGFEFGREYRQWDVGRLHVKWFYN